MIFVLREQNLARRRYIPAPNLTQTKINGRFPSQVKEASFEVKIFYMTYQRWCCLPHLQA